MHGSVKACKPFETRRTHTSKHSIPLGPIGSHPSHNLRGATGAQRRWEAAGEYRLGRLGEPFGFHSEGKAHQGKFPVIVQCQLCAGLIMGAEPITNVEKIKFSPFEWAAANRNGRVPIKAPKPAVHFKRTPKFDHDSKGGQGRDGSSPPPPLQRQRSVHLLCWGAGLLLR